MATKKLSPAQERAKAKLRTYWIADWLLEERPDTLDVLARYGLAELKIIQIGGATTYFARLPS